MRDPLVVVVIFGVFLSNSAIAMMEVVFPLYLRDRMGQSVNTIGVIFAFGTVVYTAAISILGRLGSFWASHSRWPMIMFGLCLMGVSLACMNLVGQSSVDVDGPSSPGGVGGVGGVGSGWSRSLIGVIGVWMSVTLGMAFIDVSSNPQLADLVELRHPNAFGRVYALGNIGLNLGFILGPLVGTLLRGFYCQWSDNDIFLVFGFGLCFYAPVLAAFFWRFADQLLYAPVTDTEHNLNLNHAQSQLQRKRKKPSTQQVF